MVKLLRVMTDQINELIGIRLRLLEIHWTTKSNFRHNLTDKIIKELDELIDSTMEQYYGATDPGYKIQKSEPMFVGLINPKMPNSIELVGVLRELRDNLNELSVADKNYMHTVRDLFDEFIGKINKYIYLARQR